MNQKTRSKKISGDEHKELHDLYLNKIDRINNWDLVDLGAGSWLVAIFLTNPGISCTNWQNRKTCGNAAPRL
jgi:hypothetical protein